MKTNTMAASSTNPVVIILGILAGLLVFAVLTGRKVPLISTERGAVLALVLLGMAICSQAGIGRVALHGDWFHPFSILGYLLGAAIIAIGASALFGRQIPPLTSHLQSFIAVAVIAGIKLVLTTIHRLL